MRKDERPAGGRVFYAGIGSRTTPPGVLAEMRRIAGALAQAGFVLRSGGAPGADTAFEQGCDEAKGPKEIFIPWPGFENRTTGEPGVETGTGTAEMDEARKHHPAWHRLGYGVRKLMARNSAQILGRNCAGPRTAFVIGWTPGASGQGGTGQAYRIAQARRIPVFDLAGPWPKRLEAGVPPEAAEILREAGERLAAARKEAADRGTGNRERGTRTPAPATLQRTSR